MPPTTLYIKEPEKSIERLASMVEAFWRFHQLEDVARRFQPKDRGVGPVVMFLLARIEM